MYAGQRKPMTGGDMDREARDDDSWGWGRGDMSKALKKKKQGGTRKSANRPSTAHLDKLIEEATVDCYNDSEEVTGIFTMKSVNDWILNLP